MTAFVVDARGAMSAMKQDAGIASALGVNTADIPSRGFGIVAGAHVYPLRMKKFALGIGAEWVRLRASDTVEDATEDRPEGPTVNMRWNHISPQVSANFGGRDGWSYLTAGLGRSALTFEREDNPQEDAESGVRTLNYGGGARWFMKKHLAFMFDIRWYSVAAQEAAEGRIATPKSRIRILSAGISVR